MMDLERLRDTLKYIRRGRCLTVHQARGGRRERIAGIHGLSIDTIELYERNMIDELAPRLEQGELPVGS